MQRTTTSPTTWVTVLVVVVLSFVHLSLHLLEDSLEGGPTWSVR